MKTDFPSPPVRPNKGVGPQVKVGELTDELPQARAATPNNAAAAASLAAIVPASNGPVSPLAPQDDFSDPFGNTITKPNREEALASALMALINRMDSVSAHPEMKAVFKLGKEQRIWTGAAGHWGDEMKKAKEILGI